MTKTSERPHGKEYLYRMIMLLFAVLICIVSLTEVTLFSVLNVRELGIIAFGFVDLLFLISLICEKDISGKKRMIQMIYACIATVVYMMYCKDIFFETVPGTTDDALCIAGILCVLFVFMREKKTVL